MDLSRLFTYCDVYDKDGCVVSNIDPEMKVKDINSTYTITWKDTKESLTDSMMSNLLKGRDPSIRSHGLPWPDEEKEKIREYMRNRTEPDIDYAYLKQILFREEDAIERVLKGLYTKWERYEDMTRFELKPDVVNCFECDRIHSVSKVWKGEKICYECYNIEDKQEYINKLWSELEKISSNYCRICEGEYEKKDMHFDHINVFDKNDSICAMVWEGGELEEIVKEGSRCQMLCKDCHNMVTNLERKYGLLNLKKYSDKELYPEYREKTKDIQERIIQSVKDIKQKRGAP